MEYPIKLLPKTNYKSIITGLEKKCLIRHFVSNNDQSDVDDLGLLKDFVIASGGEKQLPDLSTSLFGIFDENDIVFNVINKTLNEYCDPNHNSSLPIYEEDFIIADNRNYWSILIDNIHDKLVKYEGTEFRATCYVKHTPTKSNFWHFSIIWFINSEDKYWNADDITISSATRRKLKKETRDFLKVFAKKGTVSHNIISEEHYCL